MVVLASVASFLSACFFDLLSTYLVLPSVMKFLAGCTAYIYSCTHFCILPVVFHFVYHCDIPTYRESCILTVAFNLVVHSIQKVLFPLHKILISNNHCLPLHVDALCIFCGLKQAYSAPESDSCMDRSLSFVSELFWKTSLVCTRMWLLQTITLLLHFFLFQMSETKFYNTLQRSIENVGEIYMRDKRIVLHILLFIFESFHGKVKVVCRS